MQNKDYYIIFVFKNITTLYYYYYLKYFVNNCTNYVYL